MSGLNRAVRKITTVICLWRRIQFMAALLILDVLGGCDQINITDIGRSVIGMRYPVWVRGKGWFGGFGYRG